MDTTEGAAFLVDTFQHTQVHGMASSGKKQMGRPRAIEGTSHKLVVVIDEETLQGLDEWVEELRGKEIGTGHITRMDLMRDIFRHAIAEHQRDKRKKGTKR